MEELLLPQHRGAEIALCPGDGYVVNGIAYARVTQVLGIINKPALLPWAGQRIAEAAISRLTSQEGMGWVQELCDRRDLDGYRKWVGREMRAATNAPTRERDAAAERGTGVHRELEMALATGVDKPPISQTALNGLEFITDHSYEVVGAEVMLWDDALQVAGTCDVVARNSDGELVVWDWKTSRGVWWEYALQLGAYAGMLGALTGEEVVEVMVLHLTPEGYTCHRVVNLDVAWELFVCAARLWRASEARWV